jgi:hypothetical protein
MQKSAPVSAWHASGYVWEELTQELLVPPWGKKKKLVITQAYNLQNK